MFLECKMSFGPFFGVPSPQEAAERFKKRLEVLGCPLMQNATSSWVEEVLFRQGEDRTELLHWLILRTVAGMQIEKSFSKIAKSDVKNQKQELILTGFRALRIFPKRQVAFVKGTLPFEDQVEIFENLTLLGYANYQMGTNSPPRNMDKKLNKIVDSLTANDGKKLQIFQRNPQLFPPQLQLSNCQKKENFPSMDELVSENREIMRKVVEAKTKVKALTPSNVGDNQSMGNILKNLESAKENLLKSMVNFSTIYERQHPVIAEMTPPRFSTLGDKFEILNQMLTSLLNVVDAMESVKRFTLEGPDIEGQNVVDELLDGLRERKGKLEWRIRILEESIARKSEE